MITYDGDQLVATIESQNRYSFFPMCSYYGSISMYVLHKSTTQLIFPLAYFAVTKVFGGVLSIFRAPLNAVLRRLTVD